MFRSPVSPVNSSIQFHKLLPCILLLLIDINFVLCLNYPRIFAWGNNQRGQVGSGSSLTEHGFTDLTVLGAGTMSSFSAGSAHAAFLDATGKAYLWGTPTRIGVSPSPTSVLTPTGLNSYLFSQIICGQKGAWAIQKGSTTVYFWGDGPEEFNEYFGQGAKSTPTIASGVQFKQLLAFGAFHGAAIDHLDRLVLWGKGINGELGTGNTNSAVPLVFPVTGQGKVVKVSLGYSHTLVYYSSGKLYYAGAKNIIPDITYSGVGVVSLPLNENVPIDSIASGLFHFLLLRGPEVLSYGLNNTGQLGVSIGEHLVPMNSPTGVIPTQVGAVGNTSYALMSNGNVWSWGFNDTFKLLRRGGGTSMSVNAVPAQSDVRSLIATGESISRFFSPGGGDIIFGNSGVTMFVEVMPLGEMPTAPPISPPQAPVAPPQNAPPIVPPPTAPCPLPAPIPISEFECINGIWTKNGSITNTSITIGTPVTIQGNLTSNSTLTILNPTSSVINVTGCVVVDGDIVLVVNPDQDLSGRKLDLVLSSCITSNANLEVKTSKKSCKKYSATSETTSTSYSATFRVDSSKCRLWWIILASTLGGTLLLVAVISLISIKSGAFRRWIRPFSSRKAHPNPI